MSGFSFFSNFSDFSIVSPSDGIEGVSEIPAYTWNEGIAADNYVIEVANDPSFSAASIVETNVNKLSGSGSNDYSFS